MVQSSRSQSQNKEIQVAKTTILLLKRVLDQIGIILKDNNTITTDFFLTAVKKIESTRKLKMSKTQLRPTI